MKTSVGARAKNTSASTSTKKAPTGARVEKPASTSPMKTSAIIPVKKASTIARAKKNILVSTRRRKTTASSHARNAFANTGALKTSTNTLAKKASQSASAATPRMRPNEDRTKLRLAAHALRFSCCDLSDSFCVSTNCAERKCKKMRTLPSSQPWYSTMYTMSDCSPLVRPGRVTSGWRHEAAGLRRDCKLSGLCGSSWGPCEIAAGTGIMGRCTRGGFDVATLLIDLVDPMNPAMTQMTMVGGGMDPMMGVPSSSSAAGGGHWSTQPPRSMFHSHRRKRKGLFHSIFGHDRYPGQSHSEATGLLSQRPIFGIHGHDDYHHGHRAYHERPPVGFFAPSYPAPLMHNPNQMMSNRFYDT
ncbi:unnamed protein product, partial [Prorocentrum cordatum]